MAKPRHDSEREVGGALAHVRPLIAGRIGDNYARILAGKSLTDQRAVICLGEATLLAHEISQRKCSIEQLSARRPHKRMQRRYIERGTSTRTTALRSVVAYDADLLRLTDENGRGRRIGMDQRIRWH